MGFLTPYFFLSFSTSFAFIVVGIRTDLKLFEEELKINVIAPVATTRAFIPLLEKGTAKKVLYVTTEMGSLTLSAQVPFLSKLPLMKPISPMADDIVPIPAKIHHR